MRYATLILAAIVATALAAQDQPSKCKSCGNDNYGTTIEWEGSPSEASKLAKEQEKLVFVLHVSGYFEDPKFT